VFNSKSEVVCLNKNTGKKRWLTKLTTEEKELADWYGMILIRDHLLMISPNGRVIFLSVYDGKIKKTADIGDGENAVSVNPVIADGIMYVLMNCGKIAAYK
jgi:outer membrane protein assembly factor BamB